MNHTSMGLMGLTGFGFWLAIAFIVLALVWLQAKKQQMKHELILKLLEKGQAVDQELLAKLLATDSSRILAQLRGPGLSWPLLVLGAFTFLFGWLTWHQTHKEYLREKAEEKLSKD
jgi:heme exporter protein D